MAENNNNSPVVQFVRLAWNFAGGDPLSWERYNGQVGQVCRIAAAGFPWREGDMDSVMSFANSRCGIGRCLGADGIERLYREAVQYNNVSAFTEIERHLNRNPIIADGADGKQRGRLYVGCRFPWKGRTVIVTSFDKNAQAVCVPETGRRRLYRISSAVIKQARKQLKAARDSTAAADES